VPWGPAWRRRVIRTITRLFPGGAPFVVPLLLRWAKARGDALLRGRGLVRGTSVAWPYAGRAWTVSEDVVRPGRGEVLVRIDSTAVSAGTERAYFARMPGSPAKFPFFPGYSAAGEIVAVGRGVAGLRRGDLVALQAEHGSLALAKAARVAAVPAGVSMEEAAFIQLGVIALQAVDRAALRPGEMAVVIGAGIIGQLIAQCVAANGHPVVSVARSDRRVTAALLQATRRVVLLDRDGLAAVEALDAPVTFEVSGAPQAIPLAIRCTGRGGRIVLAGSTRGMTREVDFGVLADKAITISGAHITRLEASAWPALATSFLELLAARRVQVAPLISARIHPLEAERFYRRLARQDDATIGAVFAWEELSPLERMRPITIAAPPDFTPLRRGRMTVLPISRRGSGQPSQTPRLRATRGQGEVA